MRLIRVGAAAVNQTPLAWEQNFRNIVRALEIAREREISVLCLPEMCIPGYGCEDAFQSPGVQQTCLDLLREILPHTANIVVSLGLPAAYQNGIYNCAALIANEKLIGIVAKRFLAGDGVHYEPRWFKDWPPNLRSTIKFDDKDVPFGDLYFDLSGVRIGFEICEDAWAMRRRGIDLALEGVDIILNPSASHFAFGKRDIRKRLVLEGSRSLGLSYIYSNLLGCEAGRIVYDGATLIASGGKLIARGKRFSFEDVVVTSAILDVHDTRMNQSKLFSFMPTSVEHASLRVAEEFSFPDLTGGDQSGPTDSIEAEEGWEASESFKEEEFTRAEALALYDYMRKSSSHGFVVSLSGGVDSTGVSLLVALMVRLGFSEVGPDKFLGKLSYIKKIE